MISTPSGGSRIERKPGLHRIGDRPGSWVDDLGNAVTDPSTVARLQGLAIPPAWRQVWATGDPGDPVQATGVDARGRTQYRYAATATALASRQKFEHLLTFASSLPKLRERVSADLARSSAPGNTVAVDSVIAAIVRLLDRGLFRIGNDRYLHDNHTYGLTTVVRRQLELSGDTLTFDFVGKEHIRQTIVVVDSDAARVVDVLLLLTATPDDPLFVGGAPPRTRTIHSTEVNAYLHAHTGSAATAKVFRTWGATVAAAAVMAGAELPADSVRSKSLEGRAVRAAADLLGNSPTVARTSYVHPSALGAGSSAAVVEAVDAAATALGTRSVHRLFTDPGIQEAVLGELRRAEP